MSYNQLCKMTLMRNQEQSNLQNHQYLNLLIKKEKSPKVEDQ